MLGSMGVDIRIGDQIPINRLERSAVGDGRLNIDPKYFVGQRQRDLDSCAYFVLAGLVHFAEDQSGEVMARHASSKQILENQGLESVATFMRGIIREHYGGRERLSNGQMQEYLATSLEIQIVFPL